jgi:thiosulfate dehydrogenase [quinone] large subunit
MDYICAALRWPFAHRYASPIWLAVRLYLGWTWLQVGLGQVSSGWLNNDPIGLMFRQIVDGKIAVPLPFYRDVAQMLLEGGLSPIISHSMPIAQIAVALAFFSGVLLVPAAIGAILLNLNIILSGVGLVELDGQFIILQILLVLAWRTSSWIGLQSMLVRCGRALWRARTLLFGRGATSVAAVDVGAKLLGEPGIAD